MDLHNLAREFEEAVFRIEVMKITDLHEAQQLCLQLHHKILAQRRVYFQMMRNLEHGGQKELPSG
jgi:hypothetical protein